MHIRLLSRLLALCLVASIGGTLVVPAASAASERRPLVASSAARSTPTETLAQAEALFAGSATERRTATVRRPSATMVLRDLARRADDLPTAAQRASAARILARPTSQDDPTGGAEPKYRSAAGSVCGAFICVHWVEDATADSAKGRGNDGNLATVPVWVNTTLTTMEAVYRKEVQVLGYHAPLPDGTRGGNAKIDVYLADLGGTGIYGYCTTDQPDRRTNRRVFAYCVLDNDYAPSQFGSRRTRTQNLQVTAAHEFFHAVQFGYDWTEDLWLMEGTAVWMEDEVYDAVNDNLQYLAESPLAFPYVPLDYSSTGYLPYGVWVFWKFLSESAGRGRFDSPRIVRDVWDAAVGPRYSTAALQRVLVARRTSFSRVFSTFGTWAREPARYFSEGWAYRAAPFYGPLTLTRARRSTGLRQVNGADHMTHAYVRLVPGASLTGAWRLRISVDMAARLRGSSARVVVHRRSGPPSTYVLNLDRSGAGTGVFGFRRAVVSHVELDLVNASTRFACDRDTSQSCSGVSLDDGLAARFSATAIR